MSTPMLDCSVPDCEGVARARGWCRKHYSRWQRNGDPLGGRRGDVALRFEKYVDRSGECHRWTGTHHGKGYGHFSYKGRIRKAHTVALLLAGVDIPEGMTVDHVWARGCQHKDCVRVEHLEVVPGAVNTLRGNNPCAVNARKTHCIRGHEFTPESTRINTAGGRNCRTCINEINRAKREAQRPTTCPEGHPRVTRSDGKTYCPPCHAAARRKKVA